MKKVIAYSMFFIYFLSLMGWQEVCKYSYLQKHYQISKLEDQNLSFAKFVIMHYITDDHNNNDDAQDKQLPFKSHTQTFTDNITFNIHQILAFSFESGYALCTNYSSFKVKPYLPIIYISIWNPPK
ncbi:MAG: hypothetical protein WCP57_08815 [Bacteroidota bacterium]